MAGESIIVKYEADISALKASLQDLKLQNLGLLKVTDDLGKKIETGAKKGADATSALGNQFNKLGAQIAAAFSIGAVIAFGKASLEAFAEAELSARKLNSALSAQGGTQAQLNTLLRQSKELQSTTIFSDEQIQSAQTLALQFGLTGTEVEKLIPKIADFASATGQDLKSALESVLRGTEGNARGLKVYGIQVKDADTKTERLASITDQLTQKFGGQAQEVGETTTGAFQKLKNAFNDVQESIGELLNKGGGVIDFLAEVTAGLARFFKSDAQAQKDITFGLTEEAKQSALKSLEELKAKFISQGRAGNDAFKVLINESNTIIQQKENDLFTTLDKGKREKIKRDIDLEKARIAALEAVLADETKVRERNTKDGAEASAKNAEKIREAAVKEIEARKQSTEALREFTLKSLQDNITEETSILKLQAAERATSKEELEKLLTEIELAELEKRKALLIEFGESTADIDKQISDKKIGIITKGFSDEKGQRDAQVKDYEEWLDKQVKSQEDAEKRKQENIQATFEFSQNLLNELSNLFSAQDQAQIDAINNRRDSTIDSIDAQLAALEEANDKGRISDKKFEDEKKKLIARRAAAEAEAAAKTKKIKQEEAAREKAYSIFSIVLSTARAVMAALAAVPPNPFLAALAAITGAAQLSIAVATPIPQFAKGTKGKKDSGVGLVGEEGAEFVYMPTGTQVVPAGQTKKYKDAINSMIDGQFEQYVYRNMIAPALREATKKMEEKRSKSFAENIANVFNTTKESTNPYRVYDGVRMNNKELAEAIARAMSKYSGVDSNNRYYH